MNGYETVDMLKSTSKATRKIGKATRKIGILEYAILLNHNIISQCHCNLTGKKY